MKIRNWESGNNTLGVALFSAVILLPIVVGFVGIAERPQGARVNQIGDSLTLFEETYAPLDAECSSKGFPIQEVGITGRHSAFGGFTFENLRKVVTTIPTTPPSDVITIQLGTNDLIQVRNIYSEFDNLILGVKARWPGARIIVAPIPASVTFNQTNWTNWNNHITAYCTANHIEMVPQLNLLPSDYQADLIHPNQSGCHKMANRWAVALNPLP